MGFLFGSKKKVLVNDQAAANIDLQKESLKHLTDNPAFKYQTGNLDKINSGNYGGLSSVQAMLNEAAKAKRDNRYKFTQGSAAFNSNPSILQAMRAKQDGNIDENVALGMPGVIGQTANDATQTVQNAYGTQQAGYGNTANEALNAYKYYYTKPLISTILGAAAPLVSMIPGAQGIGAALGAAGGALGGGATGSAGVATGPGSTQAQTYNPLTLSSGSASSPAASSTHEAGQSVGPSSAAENVQKALTGTDPMSSAYDTDPKKTNPAYKFRSPFLGDANGNA